MEEEVRKSKYNTAVSKEIRRDLLWKDANNHSRSGQFHRWNEDLDTIWSELSADLKDEKKFEIKQQEIKKFDERILEVGQISDLIVGFKKQTPEDLKRRANHYNILREKEIWIRRLENELGKGTAYEDEDEDEF